MNYKKLLTILIVNVMFLSFLTFPQTAETEEKEVICRMGSHMSSRDASGMALEKFGELLKTRSQGRFKVTVANDGKLGNQREIVEMVRDAGLEATISLIGGPGHYVPEVLCLDLPYLYKDDAHYVRVLKTLRPYVEEILAPFNFKPFGYMDIGFRHMLIKKRPIYKLEDMKGLKIRAPVPMYAAMLNTLGANATMITWTEVYSALQAGVIDGMEASFSLIYAMKFHEQAKYLSKTWHTGGNFYIIAGKKWFDSLPKDLQKIFTEASEEASKYQVDLQMKLEDEAVGKLVAEGVKVNEVDNLNEFRNRLIPWREKYVKELGPNYEKFYKKILEVQ